MKRYVAAAAAALALLGAACGSDYGRDDAVEDMIEQAGLSEEQANCVADGAEEADIPWDAAEDSMQEGGEHFDAIRQILTDCLAEG